MTTLSANHPTLANSGNSYAKNVLQAGQALVAAIFALNGALATRRKNRKEWLETAAMLSHKADAHQEGSPAYAAELRYFSALSLARYSES
ncbi:hypothetical protein ACFDR9_003882 [Janthinobacterium sp. CG_23.3]|uniref:hypothetical protein n=1 Tax=unclassified Janthinobacterium TaxID=2610881 RepID=UPI00034DFC16|nr:MULTISPECIES: hypothetical protein [unclassified Janthinobacterium]MEC5159491.1 hypothetical protein [Janthinobacterium sp. CG_S6]